MPALASPSRQAPALPPKVLLYRGAFGDGSKVIAAEGRIKRVSMMTANLQPRGYPMFVDAKTLTTFRASLGAMLKAYLKHSWEDRTGEEAGLWSAFDIVGDQLLADFEALKAWMSNSKKEFETLFEMADRAPDQFGASAVFSYSLAWVRDNGTDVPTEVAGWRWNEASGDYELQFEPSAPADAVRQLPSVRVIESFSCDFVDVPAANRGLFSAADLGRDNNALPAKPVDDDGKGTSSDSIQNFSTMDIKTLHAEFGSKPAQLARAVALFSANDKITIGEIKNTIATEEQGAELAQLRSEHGTFKADLGKVDAAGFKAKGDKSAVVVMIEEHATFKAGSQAHDAAIVALKAAGFEAKDGKSALDLALAALSKAKTDIATLKAGGTVPVETGTAPASPAAAALSTPTKRLAAKFAAAAAKPTGQN